MCVFKNLRDIYIKNDSCKNMDVLVSEFCKVVKPTLNKRIMGLTLALNLRSYVSCKFIGIHREAPKCHTYLSLNL